MSEIIKACEAEAKRIEEDAEHSFKGHYNSSTLWTKAHYFIGIPLVIFSAWAGADALSSNPNFSGFLALLSAALASAQTFINPAEKSEKHKNAGDDYLALRNDTRLFRENLLKSMTENEAQKTLLDFSQKRNDLARMSPVIPRCRYLLAKKDIDEGLAKYRADERTD